MRIVLTKPPFQDRPNDRPDQAGSSASGWPCSWIHPGSDWQRPWVAAFRCQFSVSRAVSDRLHVTADERYELYLDGDLVGRGSERGDRSHWSYETYALALAPGPHTLVARVWALGPLAPWAQISIHPGFLCTPETPELLSRIATGVAQWESKRFEGFTFEDMSPAAGTGMGVGPSERIDARLAPWGWERGGGEGWGPAAVGAGGQHGFQPHSTMPVHWLTPARLPAQMAEAWKRFHVVSLAPASSDLEAQWNAFFLEGKPLTIPAKYKGRVTVDLEDYVCAYPELRWSGGRGGRLSLGWAEALIDPLTRRKTCGADLESADFRGPYDVVISDGGTHRSWHPLWWRCGRFISLEVETGLEEMVLETLALQETRYPLEAESDCAVPDPGLQNMLSLCLRTLQMCSHETYMDCPYYEQLMYVGDTRLQCLLTYALTRDSRLPRKALELFDSSRRNPSGLVDAAHPNHGGQLIPPFALWWVAMVHDYALWRGDADFVRARLPGTRAVLDWFAPLVDSSGILRGAVGWNFQDWTFPAGGVPAGGLPAEQNSILQAQWVMALSRAAELETYAGEPEMAAMNERRSHAAARALAALFWDEDRGLVADDAGHTSYSEHAQCLALLAGVLSAGQQQRVWTGLENGAGLIPTSSYFSHYLFEACVRHGHMDLFFRRLRPWTDCLTEGFSTTPEGFGGSRSDCHAWSAHPLFHFLTGVIGIRPARLGFGTVEIAPQMGPLKEAAGTLAHPLGPIHVRLKKRNAQLHAEVELPEGLQGVFRFHRQSIPIGAGRKEMTISG